eukprot:scaffold13115_cov139-Skeletonema_dohrnii-CCMP3373.AAC.1
MSLTLESCKRCVSSCPGGVGCPDAGAGADKSAGGTSAPSASKRRHDDAFNDRKRKLHRGNGNNGASIIRREIASPQTVLSVANNAAIPSAGNAPKGAPGLAAQNVGATTQLQKSKKKQQAEKKERRKPAAAAAAAKLEKTKQSRFDNIT